MSKFAKLHSNLTSVDLHKKVQTKNKPTRKVLEIMPERTISIDLVDMSKQGDKGNHYILNAIDIFTKKAWAYPMKTKSTTEMKKVMQNLLTEVKPSKIWADEEAALKSAEMKKLLGDKGISLYHSHGKAKAAVVERFNRTMKEQMHKSHGDGKVMKNWTPFVDKFVKFHNKTPHSALMDFSPDQVATSKERQNDVRINNVDVFFQGKKKEKSRFKIGDTVHVRRKKDTFEKGYTKTFTDETFTIDMITSSNPVQYRIRDKDNKMIKGSFYARDLMKSN